MTNLGTFISQNIEANAAESKLLTFPLSCGIGKSSYIRYMIAEHLTWNEGLIVVTDTITGLKDLAGHTPHEEQREIIDYLTVNRDRIALIYSDTVGQEWGRLYSHDGKPIILMTTQRYTALSGEEIRRLTSGAIPRKTIVFDEKPPLTEQRQITVKQLNEVDTAIKTAIDNSTNQNNKSFMILHWQETTQRVEELFKWYEDKTAAGKEFSAWHDPQPEIDQISRDNFLHLVNETYKAELDSYSFRNGGNILRDINAVYQMLTYGATFTSRKRSGRKKKDGTKYENYFVVVLDNKELFLDVGARCIAFDGTADIHPDYCLDFVQMVDCEAYKPSLSNLTIRIIDVNTSKNRLHNSKKLLSAIAQDIHARYGNPVVFCHKEQEKNLANMGFTTFEHFNNIKGKNDWRESDTIVEIGLNRLPDECYKLTTFYNELFSTKKVKRNYRKIEEIQAKLEGREPDFSDLPTDDGYYSPAIVKVIGEAKITETRNRAVIADMEQNLFRGAIRDGKPMQFVLYAKAYEIDRETKQRSENSFVQMVRERYEKHGATVEVIDVPEIKIVSRDRANGENSTAQEILSWCKKQKPGSAFKLKTMLAETGIDNSMLQHAKQHNSGLSEYLNGLKVPSKRGFYQIPND